MKTLGTSSQHKTCERAKGSGEPVYTAKGTADEASWGFPITRANFDELMKDPWWKKFRFNHPCLYHRTQMKNGDGIIHHKGLRCDAQRGSRDQLMSCCGMPWDFPESECPLPTSGATLGVCNWWALLADKTTVYEDPIYEPCFYVAGNFPAGQQDLWTYTGLVSCKGIAMHNGHLVLCQVPFQRPEKAGKIHPAYWPDVKGYHNNNVDSKHLLPRGKGLPPWMKSVCKALVDFERMAAANCILNRRPSPDEKALLLQVMFTDKELTHKVEMYREAGMDPNVWSPEFVQKAAEQRRAQNFIRMGHYPLDEHGKPTIQADLSLSMGGPVSYTHLRAHET